MNWFVHNIYWSQWIGRHHRRRRKVLERGGAVVVGLVALGFTSVYREGFEVVLFLQNLQLQAGTATVLQGVAIGLAGTAAVGVLTFWLHHKLPYKRMLVLTGVLLAVVLVVMTGGTALTFQDLGWLPSTPLPFAMPGWLGAWFEVYGTYETIACQLAAAILVVGSYVLAEHLKVRRPARRGAAGGAPSGHPAGQRGLTTDIVGCVVDEAELERELHDGRQAPVEGPAVVRAAPPEGARRQGDGDGLQRRRAQGGAVPLRRRRARLPERRRPCHAPDGLPARGRGAAAADRGGDEDGQLAAPAGPRSAAPPRPASSTWRTASSSASRRRPRWATCASCGRTASRAPSTCSARRPSPRRRRSATRSAARRRSRPSCGSPPSGPPAPSSRPTPRARCRAPTCP